jgi:hypothetical protein
VQINLKSLSKLALINFGAILGILICGFAQADDSANGNLSSNGYGGETGVRTTAYWNFSAGDDFVSNNTSDNYWQFSDPNYLSDKIGVFDADIGIQLSDPFGFELGYFGGPSGLITDANPGNPSSPNENDAGYWYVSGAYLMPTYRLWQPGLFGLPLFQTFGVRMGPAFMNADFNTNSTGRYTESGDGLDLGAVYRIQQTVRSLADIGIEVAYDYIDINSMVNSNGTGPGRTIEGPARSSNGSKIFLDASGISVKLVLGGWFGSPIRNKE